MFDAEYLVQVILECCGSTLAAGVRCPRTPALVPASDAMRLPGAAGRTACRYDLRPVNFFAHIC